MAWPQRGQVSAKDILGMETTEFQAKLDGAASKEDVTKLNSAVEETKGTLAQIQESLAKLTSPPPPPPDPNVQLDANDPTTQLLTDPSGYINRQTAGTQQVAAQARADVLEMRARQKYAGVFAKFGDELTTKAQTYNLAQRCQDGFWDFHVQTVVGRKALEGGIEPDTYPSLIGTGSGAVNASGEQNDRNLGFSADEVSFYKERNVPLADAAKIRDLMHRDGETINLQNYKGKVGHA